MLIQQTITKPQETLEFKMNKQLETFSISQPINLSEEGKWLLVVVSFKATNYALNITDEKNAFSISIPCDWKIPNYSEDDIIDQQKKSLKLKSQNDIELHVPEVRKRWKKMKKIQRIFFIRFWYF